MGCFLSGDSFEKPKHELFLKLILESQVTKIVYLEGLGGQVFRAELPKNFQKILGLGVCKPPVVVSVVKKVLS